MGCDIHMHIEVKTEGEWHHYSHPSVRRNYYMFSKMADVRNEPEDVEPIAGPKGLPDDITKLTELDADRWEGDAHSHSWLGSEEISTLSAWFDATEYKAKNEYSLECWLHTYLGGNGLDIHKYPEEKPEWVEDIRFVFWFDN